MIQNWSKNLFTFLSLIFIIIFYVIAARPYKLYDNDVFRENMIAPEVVWTMAVWIFYKRKKNFILTLSRMPLESVLINSFLRDLINCGIDVHITFDRKFHDMAATFRPLFSELFMASQFKL